LIADLTEPFSDGAPFGDVFDAESVDADWSADFPQPDAASTRLRDKIARVECVRNKSHLLKCQMRAAG
jgi:hypothetical protein